MPMLQPQLELSKDTLPDLTETILKHTKISSLKKQEFNANSLFGKNNQSLIQRLSNQYDPSSIFDFLHDVALVHVNAIKTNQAKLFCQKVEEDFFTLCLLNALFGDPRIALV